MTSDPGLVSLITRLGKQLSFDVGLEVAASESAYVDVVWFDKRFSFESLGIKTPKIRFHPVLPVVGFEVEKRTALDAKHVKGSVSNLDNLGALMGVLVIGTGNLASLAKKQPHTSKTTKQLEKTLLDRIYRWVYAESQPRNRIVIMWEREIVDWAQRIGVTIG